MDCDKQKILIILHKNNYNINTNNIGLHSGIWENYYNIHKKKYNI